MKLLTALLLLAGLFQDGSRPAPATEAPALEVVHLANEGFLLKGREHSVLLDAFITEAQSSYGYATVGHELWRAMVLAEEPFDDVVLALASHRHADHFQAAAAANYLEERTDCTFSAATDVIQLLSAEPSYESFSERVRLQAPARGERTQLEVDGVHVEFLHLPHGGFAWSQLQNLGQVITIDGVKVLHIGDADVAPQTFAAYELAQAKIDIALIPHWFFRSNAGAKLVESIGAKQLVACHIAPRDEAAERAFLTEHFPDVRIMTKATERLTVASSTR